MNVTRGPRFGAPFKNEQGGSIFRPKLEFRVSYKGGSKMDPLLDPQKGGNEMEPPLMNHKEA